MFMYWNAFSESTKESTTEAEATQFTANRFSLIFLFLNLYTYRGVDFLSISIKGKILSVEVFGVLRFS